MSIRCGLVQIALITVLCSKVSAGPIGTPREAWKQVIQNRLALYGHRNWIVVADSAYPSQSAEGIETMVSDAGQLEVIEYVLKSLANSRHVTPIIYTDQELHFLTDKDAPGISSYRDQLSVLMQDRKANTLLHEQIIAKLDAVSKAFHVLIIKTSMALPYTSVFFQLECAYWPPEAETRLRVVMAKHPR